MKKSNSRFSLVVIFIPLLILSSSAVLLTDEPFANPPSASELKIFLPGIVSDGLPNRDMAISPALDEMFYTVQQKGGNVSAIMHSKFKAGKWSAPEIASFSGTFSDLEPAFSADGNTLFYSSKRTAADTAKTDYDIWSVTKARNGWSAPQRLPNDVNTAKDEFYPSVSKTGNLYFTRDVGEAKEDIMVAVNRNGNYDNPVSMPAAINSPGYEFNAFIDPDEQYIIFTGFRRKDDMGGGDLYIAKKVAGEWTPAVNMGPSINSTVLDYCPFVSPDKKFLFFTSSRNLLKQPFTTKKTKAQIFTMLTSAGNGFDDIYWTRFRP